MKCYWKLFLHTKYSSCDINAEVSVTLNEETWSSPTKRMSKDKTLWALLVIVKYDGVA